MVGWTCALLSIVTRHAGDVPGQRRTQKGPPGTVLVKYSRNVHWKRQLILERAGVALYQSPEKCRQRWRTPPKTFARRTWVGRRRAARNRSPERCRPLGPTAATYSTITSIPIINHKDRTLHHDNIMRVRHSRSTKSARRTSTTNRPHATSTKFHRMPAVPACPPPHSSTAARLQTP